MRSPDNDSGGASAEGADDLDTIDTQMGSLAHGFRGDHDDPDSGGTDGAFGSGWPTDWFSSDEDVGGAGTAFLAGEDALDGAGELSPFEFEPDYVADTDTDLDLTGDGVVDGADFHEALTGLSDFHVDPADAHHHPHIDGHVDG